MVSFHGGPWDGYVRDVVPLSPKYVVRMPRADSVDFVSPQTPQIQAPLPRKNAVYELHEAVNKRSSERLFAYIEEGIAHVREQLDAVFTKLTRMRDESNTRLRDMNDAQRRFFDDDPRSAAKDRAIKAITKDLAEGHVMIDPLRRPGSVSDDVYKQREYMRWYLGAWNDEPAEVVESYRLPPTPPPKTFANRFEAIAAELLDETK